LCRYSPHYVENSSHCAENSSHYAEYSSHYAENSSQYAEYSSQYADSFIEPFHCTIKTYIFIPDKKAAVFYYTNCITVEETCSGMLDKC